MFGFSSLYVKLIGGAIAALLLFGLIADRGRWIRRAHSDEAQLSTICAAVRAAADNPKLDCKAVPQQIGELGKTIADLKAGIAKQNAAVSALAAQSAADHQKAALASQEAAVRAKAPQKASDSLTASSRAPERSSAPCTPSDTLKGSWQ